MKVPSVAPSALSSFFCKIPGAARFALAPGYLLPAPSALPAFACHSNLAIGRHSNVAIIRDSNVARPSLERGDHP